MVVVINYADTDATTSIRGLYDGSWTAYRTSDAEGESLKPVAQLKNLINLTIPKRSITTFLSKTQNQSNL